jgi:hypothetical protein
MQIKNTGGSPRTILVRSQSYTIEQGATLVLPDRDMTAARRAVRDIPSLTLTHANDISTALSNLLGQTDPSVTDDSSKGYSVGSKWINVVDQQEFTCFASTVGSAVWKKGGSGGSGGGVQTGSVLPMPSSSNRGTTFLLLGGLQEADVLFICTKNYQDTYSWNEFVLIS